MGQPQAQSSAALPTGHVRGAAIGAAAGAAAGALDGHAIAEERARGTGQCHRRLSLRAVERHTGARGQPLPTASPR